MSLPQAGGVSDVEAYVAPLSPADDPTTGVGDRVPFLIPNMNQSKSAAIVFGRSDAGIDWRLLM